MSRWRRLLAVAVCCAYPLLNHAAASLDEPRWAALGAALLAWGIASGWRNSLAALLLAVATLALSLLIAARFPACCYTPPVAINLALCTLFARTLHGGREPLVSRFARLERGGQAGARSRALYT